MDITDIDVRILLSLVEHVFLPPQLPQHAPPEHTEREINVALCHVLIQAAQAFSQGFQPDQQSIWDRMTKMMQSLYWTAKSPPVEAELKGTLSKMEVGGELESPPSRTLSSFV